MFALGDRGGLCWDLLVPQLRASRSTWQIADRPHCFQAALTFIVPSGAHEHQALQVLIWWQQGGSDVVSLLSG